MDLIDRAGERKFIQIEITDTGCGIPPKIFQNFRTLPQQKVNANQAGLSVIWGILDNHNGSISVHSEVGKGTTFQSKFNKRILQEVFHERAQNILIIDDEQVVIDSKIIEMENYSFDFVMDAYLHLQKLRSKILI